MNPQLCVLLILLKENVVMDLFLQFYPTMIIYFRLEPGLMLPVTGYQVSIPCHQSYARWLFQLSFKG